MAPGADVIYQATFFDGTWRGHADFLLRVDDADGRRVWGPYHYEVADTKLARHVKASAVLQICSYVDQLERIQGVRPGWLHVALGGSARAVETLRVDDYMAYYRRPRPVPRDDGRRAPPAYPPASTYPEPVDHCDVCRWAVECVDAPPRRRPSLPRRRHLRAAAEALGTWSHDARGARRAAAAPEPPLEGSARRRSSASASRHGSSSRAATAGPRTSLAAARRRGHRARAGLALLPPPSPGDLFFDIEGDPYALDDGLDYLFGLLDDRRLFHAIWSRDDAGELHARRRARAFERLMDLFIERLERDPDLHIYHYAPYEPTALKRLMGRYGDARGRGGPAAPRGVLVDLLRVVRQALRASVESYSIKKLEAFYGFDREIDLRDAGSSIVAFEQWLELARSNGPAADHLERIERYNRDDVVSDLRLRDWLESLREELARSRPDWTSRARRPACERARAT